MAGSTASTVAQFLAELPPERRAVVSRVRDVVRAHMPAGYVESMGWGMICWSIPLSRYPGTYNKQPLAYVCLAAQKNYYALHLTSLYMDPERGAEFARAFAATGRKLDMGKGCVRFKRADRQNDFSGFQAFADDDDWRFFGDGFGKILDDQLFAHPVDRVNRVAFFLFGDLG